MEEFRDVLDECGFQDLGYSGNKFTWCNGHGEGHTVWERLDRAVGAVDWLSMFPATKVVHLECVTSDHKPIMIHLLGIPKRVNKPWRFEQMWMRDGGCREVIEVAGSHDYHGNPMSRVEGKVERSQKVSKEFEMVEQSSLW